VAYGFTPTATANPLLPSYSINPAGTNVNQGGNFWRTLDARFIYRPDFDLFGKHIVSFGANDWLYSLNSSRRTPCGDIELLQFDIVHSYGKTEIQGAYLQDEWKFLPHGD